MKRRRAAALLTIALPLGASNPAQALPLTPHPVLPSDTQGVVFDDFDGPAGSLPSPPRSTLTSSLARSAKVLQEAGQNSVAAQ